MPLPDDVSTFTLTFGPYQNAVGAPQMVGERGVLRPVDKDGRPVILTHRATGDVVLPRAIPLTITATGDAAVGPLPYTDSPELSPTGFLYQVDWRSPGPNPGQKTIAVPAANGPIADFDKLVASMDAPGVLVPLAASIQQVEDARVAAAAAAVASQASADEAALARQAAELSVADAEAAQSAAEASAGSAAQASTLADQAQAAAVSAGAAADEAAATADALTGRLTDVEQRAELVISPNLADLPVGGLLVQTGLGPDGSGWTLYFDDGNAP